MKAMKDKTHILLLQQLGELDNHLIAKVEPGNKTGAKEVRES